MEAEKCQAIKLIFKSIYFFSKIVLYFSNRFISFQSISVFQISISNRFIFFESIFIFQVDLYYSNPTFKSVYIFQIHIYFLNRFKFFKPTLATCFFFPKRLISSKSFSMFQWKIQIGLHISNQLVNFQINLYFPNQLNWHFKPDLLITKLSKFFNLFQHFKSRNIFETEKNSEFFT